MATKKKTPNTPGLHLRKSFSSVASRVLGKPYYYWNAFAKNGRQIARSSEVYSSKQAAINSMIVMGFLFGKGSIHPTTTYMDHTGKEPRVKPL